MARRYHHFDNALVDALIGYGVNNEATEGEIVGLIRSGEHDVNKLDASNRTPLFHIVNECGVDYSQYKESVFKSLLGKAKLLLKHGSNPNIQDKRGWTVIHQCAYTGNLPMMQLFMQWGGNVCITNDNGDLPVDLAVRRHHQPIIDYLEIQSCDLKSLCRLEIRRAMGKRTYNRINELPLPSSLKLFLNYHNPYPGFAATLIVPRPFSDEDIVSGAVKHGEVREFLEENASEDFKRDKNVVTIGGKTKVEELTAMMEALYFWESFKIVQFEEQPARPPRYKVSLGSTATNSVCH